jgi:hypothetical protein
MEDNTTMDFIEIGSEDERWVELDQNCVRWLALVLAMLILCVLLAEWILSDKICDIM